MKQLLVAIVALCSACKRPQYLGASVPHPCVARDVEGCLGWMAERDLAAAELDIYEDTALRDYVQGVVARLAKQSLVASEPPRVVIADRDDTYATSGRRIVIGRTTIERLGSEAELAGVLAHELAHVEARHGVASLFGRPPDDGPSARRDAEAIADERAVWLLERAGYAPRAFGRALRAILDAEDEEHPRRADRIARVDALAAGRKGIEAREELLQHIDHMVVGRDPRLGARIGNAWVVAALGIALPLHDGDDDDDGDTVRSSDDVLALRRGGGTIVAYAIGVPWARELASSLDEKQLETTELGPLASGLVPAPTPGNARSPLAKLASAVRSTLPQPAPGTRVAILLRPRGALVLELGGRELPSAKLRPARPNELAASAPIRIAIARADRDGTLGELGLCDGRLLDSPDLRVRAGEAVKCTDRPQPE